MKPTTPTRRAGRPRTFVDRVGITIRVSLREREALNKLAAKRSMTLQDLVQETLRQLIRPAT
jgi:hypothetical protein